MLKRRKRTFEDEGFALIAVIGLMAVIAILVLVLVSVGLSATSFTGSSRSLVQARAAAQAGIDATRVALAAGCTNPSIGTTAVGSPATGSYQVSIQVPNGSGWTLGCPSSMATQVRVVSVGTATATAVGSNTSGNSVTIAAVLSTATPASGAATGPAVYSYSVGTLTGSGSINSYGGSNPVFMVKTGDVNCSGAGIAGVKDLVVAAGALTMSGSCSVSGNVYSSGALTVTGGTRVGGNAVASSVKIDSSQIAGSVWTPGLLSTTGGLPNQANDNVTGNVTAGTLTFSGSNKISGNAWVTGATTSSSGARIAGSLTTKTLTGADSNVLVSGTLTKTDPNTPGTSPYPTPTTPTVPNWLDYKYSVADWSGYTVVTLATGACGYAELNTALSTIGTNPGVIDGRNCTNGVDSGSYQQLTMKNNLAIIAKKFTLGGSAGIASASPAKLWLITPDDTDDDSPTCPSGGGFSLGGTYSFSNNISTMLYTPCDVEFTSSNVFYGQVWTSKASYTGQATFNYVPVGLPGYDLSTGTAASSTRSVLSVGTVSGG